MKVAIFGATGMIGQGVLRECLRDPEVDLVLAVGRTPTGQRHPKLREISLSSDPDEYVDVDACFFCLGVSSAGMREQDYRRITYDLTMTAARPMAQHNPRVTFIYVSGAGTDSTTTGRWMWARVKGETENALLALPFQAYMFRPGYIRPMHGATSRTRLYALAYRVVALLYPVLRRLFPRAVTTTENIGRAMLAVAKRGAPKRILDPADINALA